MRGVFQSFAKTFESCVALAVISHPEAALDNSVVAPATDPLRVMIQRSKAALIHQTSVQSIGRSNAGET